MSLVITGNPGVGKHTVAKDIANKLNYKIIDINKIAIESGSYTKNDETLDVDVIQLKKLIKKMITKKTVIVGHLAPYVISKTNVNKAIILRKNPYELIPIYKKRKYSENKISENIGSEVLGIIAFDSFKKFGKSKTIQIDVTKKSVAKIRKNIQDIIAGNFDEEHIDWLELVSKKKDLTKIFPY